jgi:PAS domain S-box-containing protein
MDNAVVNKDPDIIKVLREEERQGLLTSSMQRYDEEPVSQQKTSDEENNQTTAFIDEEDVAQTDFNEKMPDDIESLKKEILELRKELKESYERYNSLAEYFEIISDTTIALGTKDLFSDVSDVIFQASPKGRITYINSAVEKIAGYPSSSLIGEKFSKIIPKDDWKKVHKHFFPVFNKKETMDKELNSFESFIITSSGNNIPVEISGKLVRYNVEMMGRKNEVRIQGSIRDITERLAAEEERVRNARRIEEMNIRLQSANNDLKKAQEELKILNQDLEKKVEERTSEIQKLLKHKIEFIGQLGHDLRSPLTPLVGLLPTLLEKEKDPELKELLDVINRNILFMSDLVVKTLKLERLNSPKLVLNFEHVNLFDCIEKIIRNKEYNFKEKNLTVTNNVAKVFFVFIDKFEFNELIDNILTNAVKFNCDNGSISVDAQKENDFVKVSIADLGIGLTEEQIEHVFEEFYKVDPSRHELDSSGLGLSICKRIVEHHGGRIWVESPGLGKGSTFHFLLPIELKNLQLEITQKFVK